MDAPLENLRHLRDELVQCGWVITCFRFQYKMQAYIVLVERYVPPRVAPQYQIVQLTFIDVEDARRSLVVSANTRGVSASVKTVREFFGIEWTQNTGDLMTQFYSRLGTWMPASLPEALSPDEHAAVLRQLDDGSSEDPNRLYCMGVRRNGNRADGEPGRRSDFNSQKTEMLRPALIEKLGDDFSISFRYSGNEEDERTDMQIFRQFSEQQRL